MQIAWEVWSGRRWLGLGLGPGWFQSTRSRVSSDAHSSEVQSISMGRVHKEENIYIYDFFQNCKTTSKDHNDSQTYVYCKIKYQPSLLLGRGRRIGQWPRWRQPAEPAQRCRFLVKVTWLTIGYHMKSFIMNKKIMYFSEISGRGDMVMWQWWSVQRWTCRQTDTVVLWQYSVLSVLRTHIIIVIVTWSNGVLVHVLIL